MWCQIIISSATTFVHNYKSIISHDANRPQFVRLNDGMDLGTKHGIIKLAHLMQHFAPFSGLPSFPVFTAKVARQVPSHLPHTVGLIIKYSDSKIPPLLHRNMQCDRRYALLRNGINDYCILNTVCLLTTQDRTLSYVAQALAGPVAIRRLRSCAGRRLKPVTC